MQIDPGITDDNRPNGMLQILSFLSNTKTIKKHLYDTNDIHAICLKTKKMQNINCTLLKLFNTIIQVIYFVTKYWVFLFHHVTQTFTPSFKFTIFALHLLMTGIKTGIDRYLTPLHIADQCTCHGFWSRTQAIVLHRYFF